MYTSPPPPSLNDELEDWEKADLTPRQALQQPKILARPRAAAPPSAVASAFDDDAEWDRGLSRHAPLQGKSSGSGWDQNKRIWQEANTAPPLIFNQQAFPSLSSASNTPSPPLARPSSAPSQPKITLLRRPQADASRSGQSSGRSTPPTRTLGQREEEYRLARERIFAGNGGKEKEVAAAGGGGENGAGRSSSGGGQSRRGGGGGGGGGVGGQRSGVGDAGEYGRGGEQVMRQPLGPPIEGAGGFGPTNRGGFALRGRGNGGY